MTDINKDVVGARIRLDTSKMPSAFKEIDEGVKKNKVSFDALNQEISKTEKTYSQLAKVMDKTALSSEERRKKILDESNALVAQRRAAAELLAAKKQQLDATIQIVDSKLQAQLASQKKREDAIEQQEREHQKRMEALQSKANAALAREAQIRERALREEQRIRSEMDRQEAMREERLRRSNQTVFSSGNDDSSALNKIKDAALHATVHHGVYAALHQAQEALRVGLVGIEANMAGYVQTNEKYFVSFSEGTHEMVMNTQRLNEQTKQFIHTTHALGSNIMDVTESARLWGRMYKDVGVVQEMVRQSTMLSTVDLVGLQDATKMMESVMAQYGVQVNNVNDAMVHGNRLLDSWSSVAHNTMAPARDLGAAFERTGKIASETGVSFDFMNGLISSGIRNTALSGENLGNMWKTVLGTIRTDKAVNELENLGVKTRNVVNGVEEWRRAEDILLDLSVAVTDKNYDLTQSYADISRGVYQFAKLAASLNVG
ncbi:MAG: yomL, partial [Paenibacillus sp.]|nr:yomL [Paenibacillus sp.]